ncbi:unnamed protein product [Orchesella dallaii]|uniref:Uncharacterized protein n=1 Tax=Orchesella dallaii TaxID=48710 RepID=A0ABP1S620_9HEXA
MSSPVQFLTFLVGLNFVGYSLGCFSTFKNAQNISFVQEDCQKSAGFQEMPSMDDLGMEKFDDQCISKCILNGLQMIDNEGQIDKDILLDFMEINAPEAYLLKLSELSSSCSESSGSDKIEGGSKTGKTREECAPMQKFYSCFLAGAGKLC